MESKCEGCGSPKSHPDNRYFVCGADAYGQYSRPANCVNAQVAAKDARIASLAAEVEAMRKAWLDLRDSLRDLIGDSERGLFDSPIEVALCALEAMDATMSIEPEDSPNAR